MGSIRSSSNFNSKVLFHKISEFSKLALFNQGRAKSSILYLKHCSSLYLFKYHLFNYFYNGNDESSNISNSSEVKESYPSICDDVVGNPDLRAFRKKKLNKLIIEHLNVNSLRNKLEFLKEQIQDNIDILMISETKIDASFPIGQFLLNGYRTPFRLDRNTHSIICSGRYSFETFTCGRKSY